MNPTERQFALVVIDVQLGMFSVPGAAIHAPEAFLSSVARLVSRARSSGVPVIYVQHVGGPGHPLESTADGGRIHPTIAPISGESVIQKRESDAFQDTNLDAELTALGVTDVVMCGLQTEYCVDTTCRRAYSLGYKVHLAQDAHSTTDTESLRAAQIIEHHNETLGNAYVSLCRAEDAFAQA